MGCRRHTLEAPACNYLFPTPYHYLSVFGVNFFVGSGLGP